MSSQQGRPAPAVRIHDVTKTFGDVIALDQVSIEIQPGRLHGIVGPNGAGKTTLLGLLLGLAAPDDGELEVLGAPVAHMLGVPDGVAGFVDAPGLYPALTARQNLVELMALHGRRSRTSREDAARALADVGLTEVTDDRVRGFSLGMRQRLGLAAALVRQPRLLILDEPVNGLDPAGRRHVHDLLTRLAGDGTAVVISSHRMDDLSRLCSEVTILATGRVEFSGPVAELAARFDVIDHRVVTTDPAAARAIAAAVPGLTMPPATTRPEPDALIVRGTVDAVDTLVERLLAAGVRVRELGPVIPPLEAAFLALTGGDTCDTDDDNEPDPPPTPPAATRPLPTAEVAA